MPVLTELSMSPCLCSFVLLTVAAWVGPQSFLSCLPGTCSTILTTLELAWPSPTCHPSSPPCSAPSQSTPCCAHLVMKLAPSESTPCRDSPQRLQYTGTWWGGAGWLPDGKVRLSFSKDEEEDWFSLSKRWRKRRCAPSTSSFPLSACSLIGRSSNRARLPYILLQDSLQYVGCFPQCLFQTRWELKRRWTMNLHRDRKPHLVDGEKSIARACSARREGPWWGYGPSGRRTGPLYSLQFMRPLPAGPWRAGPGLWGWWWWGGCRSAD